MRQCGSRTSVGTGAPVASVCTQDMRSLDPALIRAGWGWGRPRLVLPQGADELSRIVRPLQACTEADCWVKLAPLFVKTDRAYPGIFLVRHSPRITVQLRVISSSRCSCLWHVSVFYRQFGAAPGLCADPRMHSSPVPAHRAHTGVAGSIPRLNNPLGDSGIFGVMQPPRRTPAGPGCLQSRQS